MAMKCPKCGKRTAQSNELALWCTSCDWEVVDPGPLHDDSRVRSAGVARRKRRGRT